MGYNLSTLTNLTVLSGYYFILLGKSYNTYGRSGNALYNKFDEIAERIGLNSAIVKGHKSEKIIHELIYTIQTKPWFEEAYITLLKTEPALVIMKPHPKEFEFDENDMFAVLSFDALDSIYSSEYDLIRDIIALATRNDTGILEKAINMKTGVNLLRKLQ